MIYASSYSDASERARTVGVNGRDYVLREYVGAAPVRGTYVEGNERNDNAQPQGFLVDQPGGAITKPHFHEHNQFQVFVAGHARMGKHAAAPLSVHYAGAHSPYGPITAGPEGVRYFTLRQRWDPGAKYMPAMRDRLVRGQQRIRLVEIDSALQTERNPSPTLALLAEEDDGLAVTLYRVAPGASQIARDPASGGGQYWLVVSGEVEIGGERLDELGCAFVDPDEAAIELSAVETPVTALMMQFPRTADEARA